MLRQLISEVVKMRVIAQYVDVETDATGKEVEVDIPGVKTIDTLINGDDGDDVNFILNKYNRGTPIFSKDLKIGKVRQNVKTTIKLPIDNMKTGSGSGSPKKKSVSLAPENDEMMQVAEDLVGVGAAKRLINVIAPFGAAGYDAIYRLWSANERYNEPFPFFMTAPALRRRDNFPTMPSKSIIQKIAETRPNIGGKATGRGELLFALMTGGIAGGEEGDITIAGVAWEMKDITGVNTARLGERSSAQFRDALADPVIYTAMRKVETFSKLSATQLDDIEVAWQVIAKSLAGFVLVDGDEFMYVDSSALTPTRVGEHGRVTVKLK